MSCFVIQGGVSLDGCLQVQGAKNAVLPILAATLLNGGENVIHHCPDLRDVRVTLDILRCLGCSVRREGSTVWVDSSTMEQNRIADDLVRQMRSSVIFLGAILARCRQAQITYPGGCELGARPIDLHLKAFRTLGVQVEEAHGEVYCDGRGLRAATVSLDFPSVGATENVMLSAVFAPGVTRIVNAAKEPEIVALQTFLNQAGAKVWGAGTAEVYIEGVEKLHRVEHFVIPDRIVASTLLCATAATGGSVRLTHVSPSHLDAVLAVLEECGCRVRCEEEEISLHAPKRLQGVHKITTMPYPGFPTDAQAPLLAMLTVAHGTSVIAENMFESRWKHVEDLIRMGADITLDGRVAVVRGVEALSGAEVTARDLRGGAALTIAGLMAKGKTRVQGISLIDRGYEQWEEQLTALGAQITRIGGYYGTEEKNQEKKEKGLVE